jgi:hypothetical protein
MPIWARNKDGKPTCGRITNSTKKPCRSTVLDRKTGRCFAAGHGGGEKRKGGRPHTDTPSPTTIRRRERALKAIGIFDLAEQARHDPEILEHRDNIIFIDALIQAKAEGLVPPLESWQRASELYKEALTGGNATALKELGGVLADGLKGAETIEEIVQLMEHQRKHRESEMRREAQLAGSLNPREANWVILQLLAILKKVVTDQQIPREHIPEAAADEIVRVFGSGTGAGLQGAHAGALN